MLAQRHDLSCFYESCDNEMHGCQAYGCQNKEREGWVKGKRFFQMPINSLRSASWRWNGSTILVRVILWKNSISTGEWFARIMSPLMWNTGCLDWVKDDCWTKVPSPLKLCTERKVRGRRVGVAMAREERSRKRDELYNNINLWLVRYSLRDGRLE